MSSQENVYLVSVRETVDNGLMGALSQFEGDTANPETITNIERTVTDYLRGVVEAGFITGMHVNKITTDQYGHLLIDYEIECVEKREETFDEGLTRVLWSE